MKQCHFCTNNIKSVDYKEVEALKKFIDPQAKILKKNKSGLCAKHQRKFSLAVKRARFMALLPYIAN